MKINSGDIHTDVNEGVDEMVFKVDDEDQGFIFEMLRSKIYSDSIAAICREISANSRDANREVMKGHIPVEIGFRKEHHLDGGSSLHVYFKDEGPGISPDRMANVFCKYAKSTKRDTDELTGGFGLGAKTPFAYADAFNIETVVDGVKYLYTAYIDESRRGKIAKLSEEKCDEPNGTTIVVPISPSDRHKFEQSIISYTSMWDVRPTYVGIDEWDNAPRPSIEDLILVPKLELENGRVLYIINNNVSRMFNTGMGVIVDGMPYTLDTRQIPGYEGRQTYQLYGVTLVLRMETGEIDLSVNRETIQYTQKTLDAISVVMDLAAKKMASYLTYYVDNSSNYFEACTKAWSIFFDNDVRVPAGVSNTDAFIVKTAVAWIRQYLPTGSIKEFKYKGREIVTSNPKLKHLYFRAGYITDGGNVMYREMTFSFKAFSRRGIYLLDTKTKSAHRTKVAIQGITSNEIVLICKREFKPNEALSDVLNAANEIIFNDEMAEDIKTLEDMEIPYKLYSSIPLPKTVSSSARYSYASDKKSAKVMVSVRQLVLDCDIDDRRKLFVSKNIEVLRKSGPEDAQHKTLYLVVSDMSYMPEFNSTAEAFAKFISAYYGMQMFVVSKRASVHFADCLDLDTAISAFDTAALAKVAKASAVIDTFDRAKRFGMYDGVTFSDDIMEELRLLKRAAKLYGKINIFGLTDKFLKHKLPILLERYSMTVTAYSGKVSEFMDKFEERYPMLSGNLRYIGNTANVTFYIKLMDEYYAKQETTKTK